jgi:hypothetical protein
MADEMFFSPDSRSLHRGRRVAKRTATSRPCVLWPSEAREMEVQGTVLNINPYGMLIRTNEPLAVGTVIRIQLMRDEDYREALSIPVEGCVVRQAGSEGTFTDHGIRVQQKDLRPAASRTVRLGGRTTSGLRSRPTKMHTIDITVSDSGIRRAGR